MPPCVASLMTSLWQDKLIKIVHLHSSHLLSSRRFLSTWGAVRLNNKQINFGWMTHIAIVTYPPHIQCTLCPFKPAQMVASLPGPSQILSRNCGKKLIFRHSCEIKSGSGLGMRLPRWYEVQMSIKIQCIHICSCEVFGTSHAHYVHV